MKQNKYDDATFFQKYSQMDRSKGGLSAAGEWETLKSMLPDFAGRRVLDLGCGYGWHCQYAIEQGAKKVTRVDISKKMLEVAREKTDSRITYYNLPIEEIDFEENSFDIVISSLAFHYIPDFGEVCHKIAAILSPGGDFVFSVEHPVFTAFGTQDWWYDEKGGKIHWPVDHYFIEGKRDAVFLGEEVIKYHKTVTTYINTLLASGFALNGVIEPVPTQDMLQNIPEMKDELRRPMMLLVAATKK